MNCKVCTGCENRKPLSEFYGDSRAKDGKQSRCKVCHNAKQKSEEGNAKRRENYDPESRKLSYEKHKDRARAKNREYYQKTKDQKLAYGKVHYQQNKAKYAEYTRTRQARLLQRTPSWLSEEDRNKIKYFYWLAKDLSAVSGESYHVDHIVPLQGKNVCGLHVPWNLQILPADINLSKGNKHANDA